MTSTTMIPGLRAIVQRPRLTLEQRIELEAFWRKTTQRGELHQLRLKAATVEVADAMYCEALVRWKEMPADASTLDVQTEYATLKSAEATMLAARAEKELPTRCGACRDLSFIHNYGPGCTSTKPESHVSGDCPSDAGYSCTIHKPHGSGSEAQR